MTNKNDNFDDDQSQNDYNDSDYFVTDENSQTEIFETVSPNENNEKRYYGEDQTEILNENEYDDYPGYDSSQFIFDINDFHYDNLSPQDTYGDEWVTKNAYEDLYNNALNLDDELATVSRDSRSYYNEVSRLQARIEEMSDEDQKNAQSIRAKQEALEDRETELRQRESDVEYDEKKNKILKRTLIGVSIISSILALTFIFLWFGARNESRDAEGQNSMQSEQVQQLQEQLESEKKAKATAENQAKDLQDRVNGLNNQITDINKERDSQKKKLEDQNKQLKDLEEQIQDLDNIEAATVTTTVESRSIETQVSTVREQDEPVTQTQIQTVTVTPNPTPPEEDLTTQ